MTMNYDVFILTGFGVIKYFWTRWRQRGMWRLWFFFLCSERCGSSSDYP